MKPPKALRQANYGHSLWLRESLVGRLHRVWRSPKRQAGPQNPAGPALGSLPSILATMPLWENSENGALPLTTKTEFPELLQGDGGLLQDLLEVRNPGRREGEADEMHPNRR